MQEGKLWARELSYLNTTYLIAAAKNGQWKCPFLFLPYAISNPEPTISQQVHADRYLSLPNDCTTDTCSIRFIEPLWKQVDDQRWGEVFNIINYKIKSTYAVCMYGDPLFSSSQWHCMTTVGQLVLCLSQCPYTYNLWPWPVCTVVKQLTTYTNFSSERSMLPSNLEYQHLTCVTSNRGT